MSVTPALLERVAAAAAGVGKPDRLGAEITEHRGGRQRTLLEYRFEGLRLFAKRYPHREDAVDSYDLLRRLHEQAFGRGSPYRVSEPLACFADLGVLLVRAAEGRCVTTMAANPVRWEQALRSAARWLARLHSLPAAAGARVQDRERRLFRLAQRAAGAAARHPSVADVLLLLIEELFARAEAAVPPAPVQTHGRYHAEHVFVASGTVTVIDLDRASVADPAKDLGEFLHRLRMRARRARPGDADPRWATTTFLEEYEIAAGAVPDTLAYYWSYSVLSTMLRLLERDHPHWPKRLDFYRAEFDAVPGRADAFGRNAPGAVS